MGWCGLIYLWGGMVSQIYAVVRSHILWGGVVSLTYGVVWSHRFMGWCDLTDWLHLPQVDKQVSSLRSEWSIDTVIRFSFSFFLIHRRALFALNQSEASFVQLGEYFQNMLNGATKVPGEIKRSRDLRGGRWSWTFKLAQKRSWVGRWSWAAKVGLLLLRAVQTVRQQQCSGLCLCDSAQAQQLKQQLRSAQVAGQWQGDTALTLPLFWRRSTVSPVSFRQYPRSSLHSFVPPPSPVPVPNKPPHLCGHKAKWSRSFLDPE